MAWLGVNAELNKTNKICPRHLTANNQQNKKRF